MTLKDILEALGEKIEPVWCLHEGETCPRSESCGSRPVWDKFGRLVDGFLSSTSLAEAAGRA
jgi:DNA-binding IscR family transcriptional regulator